ncbi:MAG: hypothetical protein MMC33_005168 [Icmadophila ericetorum]|nr:hypothetical protein [Icmadophila ericetorum]
MLGVTHAYPREKALKFRAIDIYFFQGGDPRTSAFLFFAFLDTPTNNNREGEEKDTYLCHISLSYPHRAGFLGRDEPIEVPSSSTERLALMKEISQDWADPFKSIIQDLPDNAEPKRLSIEDWAPGMEGREWDNLGGRVTLVGDSAGAMTMYRGEAYNHGILSTQTLLKNLLPILQSPTFISDPFSIPSSTALATAISTYESELIARTRPAVLASRAACRDAHDYERIGEKSPLVARRIENLAIEEDEGIVKWVEHQGESLKEGPEVAIEA